MQIHHTLLKQSGFYHTKVDAPCSANGAACSVAVFSLFSTVCWHFNAIYWNLTVSARFLYDSTFQALSDFCLFYSIPDSYSWNGKEKPCDENPGRFRCSLNHSHCHGMHIGLISGCGSLRAHSLPRLVQLAFTDEVRSGPQHFHFTKHNSGTQRKLRPKHMAEGRAPPKPWFICSLFLLRSRYRVSILKLED